MRHLILLILIITFIVRAQKDNINSSPYPKSYTTEVPIFSVQHGFYNDNFDVTISSPTPNSTIKYTLDGSDPQTSKTALLQDSSVTILIDPESTEKGRTKTPGVVLRACIILPDSTLSESITQTYLFINEVAVLSPDGVKPGAAWPNPTISSNPQRIDYGMDPDVLNDPRYKNLIVNALLSIPTISIVTDLDNLFAAGKGIYVNAYEDGRDWERPASIELLNPDGTEGFQINAGIRIRGGASRSGNNPKHAFRIFFRSEYGKGKLKYPLFGDEGVDEFDKVDLRTSQNYSWSFPDHLGQYNTMNRDVFSRDLQREMGEPYTRSRYYHLYINGVYWGLYQTQERSEANYAESYFGGDKNDYDVIKVGDGWPSSIDVTDGNFDAYKQVWNYCQSGFQDNSNYSKLQGLNPDGTINPAYKNLVDIDNLIDFMLIVFYTGNFDCPITKFYQNNSPRNFYCIYNRNRNDGFKFLVHDAEHSLRTTTGEGPGIGLNENRVNIGDLNDNYKMVVTNFSKFHPQWLHYKLSDNTEYRIRFADHVYKYLFNNGCMTPEKATKLFLSSAKEIDTAIIAESARWGDVYSNPSRTKDDDWQPSINDIVNNYFPVRTGIVLNQLKGAKLYPGINPPVYYNNGEEILSNTLNVQPGFVLKMQKPGSENGTIEYTINGQDPRNTGGAISSSANEINKEIEITINSTMVIKSRVLNGTTWSALHEITLFTDDNTNNIKVTEINYHPLDNDNISDNEYEFLELKNIGTVPVIFSEATFVEGIDYTFPTGTILEPDKFIVLASNSQEFNNRYGFFPFGKYSGQLDNGGETITLVSAEGDTIFSVTYDDSLPWPTSADGGGFSLVTDEINPSGNLNDPKNWRASYNVNGSPGMDDLVTSVNMKKDEIPTAYKLNQNYPNPFNPSTVISYQVPRRSFITLKVYDILGREVATLVNEEKSPGYYNVTFSGQKLASGIYLYRIDAGTFSRVKKLVLLK